MDVAIKDVAFADPSDRRIREISNEVFISEYMEHPNVVTTYHHFVEDSEEAARSGRGSGGSRNQGGAVAPLYRYLLVQVRQRCW